MNRTAPKPTIPAFGQHTGGAEIFAALRYLLLVFGIFALFQLQFISRPLVERIETKFKFDLPEDVQDVGWYDYSWDGYVNLIKFTVNAEELEATLHSSLDTGVWEVEGCLKREREAGFMPEFYTDPTLNWWQPFSATTFDGTSCYAYNPRGLAPNYHLMVDYSIPGEATVYFEQYSIDADNKRALVD